MARFSKVTRRMWGDAGFKALTAAPPNGQTLWLRLLTGPELTTIPGLFQAWEAGLAQSLGWPLEGFRKAFGEVFREGLAKADWKAGLVWVPNAIRHNEPESPNVVRSWRRTWEELPESPVKDEAFHVLKAFAEAKGEGFAKAFAEGCRQPSPNQEQEQEQDLIPALAGQLGLLAELEQPRAKRAKSGIPSERLPDIAAVLEHWATRAYHKRRPIVDSEDRRRRVNDRLTEGFTVEDLCDAIDGASLDDNLMGRRDGSPGYRGVETILRDTGIVERLIELNGKGTLGQQRQGSGPKRKSTDVTEEERNFNPVDWFDSKKNAPAPEAHQ